MNVFIDTNVLLSFFHYSSDELEELNKLIVLVQQKKVTLFVTTQLVQEFRRNREVKIADALKKLNEQRLNLKYPQICKDYPEYKAMRGCLREYEKHHSELLAKLTHDIQAETLKADSITGQLFKLGHTVNCEAAIPLAERRRAMGNPPGKNDSLGDAINWEALLSGVPDRVDLHFISDDRDFVSPLDEDAFNGFLAQEWSSRKSSRLIYYRRLSSFFKEHFPDIKLAAQLEKDLLIESLASSSSFAHTHTAIAKLAKYQDFEPAQANALLSAAVSFPAP